VGARIASDPLDDPWLALVRTLCARAELRLTDEDLALVATTLASQRRQLDQLGTFDLPASQSAFEIRWT
jgi:hypothetical protein